MFNHLSIDWGHKRCGLAYGDIHSGIIIPATFSCPTSRFKSILAVEVNKHNIQTIVVGYPTNFHFQKTQVTREVESFTKELKNTFKNIEFVYINERNSTRDIQDKSLLSKDDINHLAACNILEAYFQKVRPQISL